MLTDQHSDAVSASIATIEALAPRADRSGAAAGLDLVGRCEEALHRAGLRLTVQRRMLSELIFGKGDRHITAETLHAAAVAAGMKLSAATVYNTLNQFTELGLLRQIGIGRSKSFFDTNTTVHPHFFFDGEGVLSDVPEPELMLDNPPEPLPGYAIERIDVIVHLRRKQAL